MYQHPIPQNVTSYQFRIVGDMTLKQFLELASGICLAILIYYTNLPSFIRWPLIISSVVLGIGLAFVPFEERPLEQWLRAYLKAIYQPTQFVWHKHSVVPDFFNFKAKNLDTQISLDERSRRQSTKQLGLNTFIKTLPHHQQTQQIDDLETSHLNNINELFYSSKPNTNSFQDNNPTPPNTTLPTSNKITTSTTTSTSEIFAVPTNSPTILNTNTPKVISTPPSIQPYLVSTPPETSVINSPQAITSNNLPFPSTPSTPNTLVGMVLSKDNLLISDAIIEIKNNVNEPVRATKTNKLGQFFSSTPLKNGHYNIYVQKDGFNFDIISIDLSGEIVSPLSINATS